MRETKRKCDKYQRRCEETKQGIIKSCKQRELYDVNKLIKSVTVTENYVIRKIFQAQFSDDVTA